MASIECILCKKDITGQGRGRPLWSEWITPDKPDQWMCTDCGAKELTIMHKRSVGTKDIDELKALHRLTIEQYQAQIQELEAKVGRAVLAFEASTY